MGTHPIFESDFDCLQIFDPPWEKKRDILTSSLSATSIPVNPLLPVTSSTSAEVSTSEPSRSSRRKPMRWVKVPSSTRGFWTSRRPSENEVSPSISPSGSSRPTSSKSPSLTPPVTVIEAPSSEQEVTRVYDDCLFLCGMLEQKDGKSLLLLP